MPDLTDNDGVCSHEGCDKTTTTDFPSIVVGDDWFCSPVCAQRVLHKHEEPTHSYDYPVPVSLFDPQLQIDREELPNTPAEALDITTAAENRRKAIEITTQMSGLYPGNEFRLAE